MNLYDVLNKIIASRPSDWHRIGRGGFATGLSYPGALALPNADGASPNSLATSAHTDYAVLKSDVAITMAWGMTAGGDYRQPWATRCPDPSAWTGFIDIGYRGTLVHRDVYVSVDGDPCYLPIPRNLEDLRVAPAYAQLTALVSTLSLGVCDYCTYMRRTGLKLADLPWPLR